MMTGGAGWESLLLGVGEVPDGVLLVAAAGAGAGAEDAEDAHVVLDRGQAGGGAVADHELELFDVAVALGGLGEHDGGMLFAVDEAGLEDGRADAEDLDVVGGGEVAHAVELVDCGVGAVGGDLRVAADVADSVAGEVGEVRGVGWSGLAAQLHLAGVGRFRRSGLSGGGFAVGGEGEGCG